MDLILEKLYESLKYNEFIHQSYQRSKALLEKTKYALADFEIKKNEEKIIKSKDQKAQERQKIEEKKVELVRKRLEKEKQ